MASRLVTLCGSIKPLYSGQDDFHDRLNTELAARGIAISPVDIGRWGVQHVPTLLQQVAAQRPDAILMQYPTDAFNKALGPHFFATVQRLAPFYVTLHEFALANALRRLSTAVLIARARGVIMTAETEQRALTRWYPWSRRKTHIIPIGANFPGLPWQPIDPPIVACFGQIRPEKGIEEFIAICKAIVARHPQVRFVLVGSQVPKFADYYRHIANEAQQQGIAVQSALATEDVPAFLRTVTVAVLPFPSGASFRRGSLLAAMACGVPIVTLQGDETPNDMVKLLQPGQTADDCARQLNRYLDNPTERQAAHRASCQVAETVSWPYIGAQYHQLLFG
jgi:glycosyltransferase involved in cell wall biosynthesis